MRWLSALAVYHLFLAFIVQPLVLPKDAGCGERLRFFSRIWRQTFKFGDRMQVGQMLVDKRLGSFVMGSRFF